MSNPLSNNLYKRIGPEVAQHVQTAALLPQIYHEPMWALPTLAGRLVELCSPVSSAVLAVSLELVQGAQKSGETTVWVTSPESTFFPFDAAMAGVDLCALSIVRVPGLASMLSAADKLARSGAFGLIVIDLISCQSLLRTRLVKSAPMVSIPQQSRLLTLARKYQIAVVFLTSKSEQFAVTGSLISLRGEPWRSHFGTDFYKVKIRALKDKQYGPGWCHETFCCGPAGLR